MRTLFSSVLVAFLFLVNARLFAGTNYYLDGSAAIDGDGTLQSPWNNISSVNNHAPFLPGDSILVKRGTTCLGELWPKGSGDASAQIVLGAYGSAAAKPIIDAQGASNSAANSAVSFFFFLRVGWISGCSMTTGLGGSGTTSCLGSGSGFLTR